jgi:hypothetical protein
MTPWYIPLLLFFVPKHIIGDVDQVVRSATLATVCFVTLLAIQGQMLYFFFVPHYGMLFVLLMVICQGVVGMFLFMIKRGVNTYPPSASLLVLFFDSPQTKGHEPVLRNSYCCVLRCHDHS